MLRRGLKTLNELDAAEAAKRAAAEELEIAAARQQKASEASTSAAVTSSSSSNVLALSPASWDQWLADGGVDIPLAVLC
ncbi:hypothetical protein V496_00197 [Pseudogymnoascus sp. VKM F-4515 (FW-2607)]|nr:hypothetical protein V496_00197 [Pseudogymnoascus sp. VKM F-4515 (FW-2607)]